MRSAVVLRLAALPALALLVACAAPSTQRATVPRDARRIVSLVPSLTEDLCAIGAGGRLVGVSQFSSDIACAAHLPQVSNYSSVNSEKVLALHADTLVAIPAQRAMTAALRRSGLQAVYLHDDSFDDLFTDIERLGTLTDRQREAGALRASLRKKTLELQKSERFLRRPSVFVALQAQPIWTVGPQSYISTLIGLAGGRNAVANLGAPYAQYSAEALLRLQPDAIIAGSDTQISSLLQKEPWRSLRAVRLNHVYIYDPALLDRPGPRYNQGLSWLIERLRPIAAGPVER